MNARIAIATLWLFLTFGACSAADTEKSADAAAPAAALKLPRASPPLFIVTAPTCAHGKEGSVESPLALMLLGTVLKPLVETAVPAAVGWLYDKGVGVLEARNAKLQSSSTAVTTTVMYDAKAQKYKFGCIVLARAARGDSIESGDNYLRQEHGGKTVLPAGSPWALPGAQDYAQDLHISRVPEFYLELALGSEMAVTETDPAALNALPGLLSKGKTVLSPAELEKYKSRAPRSMYRYIWPTSLDYFASGAEKVNNGSKNVSMELHLDVMDDKGAWQPFYAKTYDFGSLKVGTAKINVESAGKDIFVPPPARHTADGYIAPVPIRISAVLTETDENIDLSRALEAAFKDSQAKKASVDAVAKAVVDKLDEKIDEKTGTTTTKKN